MHPSFGIEYRCASLKWEDVMKGPSREAALAHTFKVLHYRTLFGPDGAIAAGEDTCCDLEQTRAVREPLAGRYAAAA